MSEINTGGVAFNEGDRVHVLRFCRLPRVEEVIHTGVIEKITTGVSGTLYWVSGRAVAQTAQTLREAK